MTKNKTKMIAVSGILLALSIITLFAATFIPGIELTLFALSSVFVAMILIEFTIGAGWLFYIASGLLSFLLIPNKGALIPYALFFGIFPIIKYYVEKDRKLPQVAEVILKLLLFNGLFAFGFYLFGEAFTGTIQIPDLAFPLIIAGGQVFFLVYDYILSLIIGYYLKRRPKL